MHVLLVNAERRCPAASLTATSSRNGGKQRVICLLRNKGALVCCSVRFSVECLKA